MCHTLMRTRLATQHCCARRRSRPPSRSRASMSTQKALLSAGPPAPIEEGGEEETDSREQYETQSALLQYVFQRASGDGALSREQAKTFQNAQRQASGSEDKPAALVGRRLAQIGDEIDAEYNSELEELVQLSGSPAEACTMFMDIVKNLFEWDERGGAKINVGRIAALLAYCYRLCKTYLQNNLSTYGLLSFLAMVSSWLFRFLLKAKFYDWLDRQGGWAHMVAATTSGWGQHTFLVIGVASLAIWMFSYFRSR